MQGLVTPGWQTNALYNTSTLPKTILNFDAVFETVKTLGTGGMGRVILARDRQTGQPYAIKLLLTDDRELLKSEIGSLYYLSRYPNCNPYVVCYYDSFQIPGGVVGMPNLPFALAIVMEYIPGPDLHDFLEARGAPLSIGQVLYVANWILYIISELHRAGYVHRDIKPSNIIVQTDVGHNGELKLIDFGIACFADLSYQPNIPRCNNALAGTPGYFSPELANSKYQTDLTRYYRSSDVFAIGVLIYYLLTHQYPYPLDSTNTKIIGPYRPINTGNDCLNVLLPRLLELNPDIRPSADEAYKYISKCKEMPAAPMNLT